MTVDLFRFGSDATDASEDIIFLLEPNPIAPAGVGGECLFRNLWLVVTYNSVFDLTLTPIVDGNLLELEAFTWTVTSTRDDPVTERFEFALGRSYPHYADPKTRFGVRGEWFGFKLTGIDVGLVCGIVELEGSELEYEVLREGLPLMPFSTRALLDASREPTTGFFFGGATSQAPLYLWGDSPDDAGTAIDLFAEPNPIAPAGIGIDHLYRNIYLCVTHSNRTDYTLIVTPILDDVELPTINVTVPGVRNPVVQRVIEIGMTKAFVGSGTIRHGLRGTWFTFRLEGDGTVPDGELIVEGATVEWEMLRETEGAINVAPDVVTVPLPRTQTVSLDARIQALAATKTTGLDALLDRATFMQTLVLDAILTGQETRTAALDAALKRRGLSGQLGFDAVIAKALLSKTTSLDAKLQALANTKSLALDAVLSPAATPWTDTRVLTLDAILAALNETKAASLDATLVRPGFSKVTSLNAILSQPAATQSVGLDATLLGDQGIVFGGWGPFVETDFVPWAQTFFSKHIQFSLGGTPGTNPGFMNFVTHWVENFGLTYSNRLVSGHSKYTTNGDFDIVKWKTRVTDWWGSFSAGDQAVLNGWIADGTWPFHMMLDDIFSFPGQDPTVAELDEMARFSKNDVDAGWANLATCVRRHASGLAVGSFVNMDAAWNQYGAHKGDLTSYIQQNEGAISGTGMKNIWGLNVLDGGDGRSGQPGFLNGAWVMDTTEITEYGEQILAITSNGGITSMIGWEYHSVEAGGVTVLSDGTQINDYWFGLTSAGDIASAWRGLAAISASKPRLSFMRV